MTDGAGRGRQRLEERVRIHLETIYGEDRARGLVQPVIDTLNYTGPVSEPEPYRNYWDETDCWAITYATTFHQPGEPGLHTLGTFFERHLADAINGVHVLPFFSWSSDDGFAVTDYYAVDERAGDWDDVRDFATRFRLMADLVINHGSAQSEWFRNFCAGRDPGRGYYKTVAPDADLSRVVRPRSTPLRQKVETAEGEQWVWCTFGPDQVDFDFGNPDVLLQFVDVVRFYLGQGVRVLRLDAVAFLWKTPGTPSLHDQKTHEIIKLLRTLVEFFDPAVMLITETNVPNRDNITYFGNSNEAHAIYNFSLPPLLIYTLLTGNCRHLKTWLMSMPPARHGTAYLNFIASHDGIGLRPTDGLLSAAEREELLATLAGFGGKVSMRSGPDGAPHPYEVNISLMDALSGSVDGPDEHNYARFLCAHAIMLALEGIPAIYVHSLLGTRNDHERVAETGRFRSINRRVWELADIEERLVDPSSEQAQILAAMTTLLKIRRRQPAFHPNAIQFTLQLGLELFGVWRQSIDREQDIFCVSNVTRETRTVELENLNLVSTARWRDLIGGEAIAEGQRVLELEPYQTVWLTNR